MKGKEKLSIARREYVNEILGKEGKTPPQIVSDTTSQKNLQNINIWEHSFTISCINHRERSNDFPTLPHLP